MLQQKLLQFQSVKNQCHAPKMPVKAQDKRKQQTKQKRKGYYCIA
jgi:hypothetical protein